jgi:hypothetical protein
MLGLRRVWPGLLREQLPSRPRLSQRHLLALWRSGRGMLLGRQRDRPLRGRFGLHLHLLQLDRPLCNLRNPGRALLHGQRLHQWLLLCRLLPGRWLHLHPKRVLDLVRNLQVRTLHVRKPRRALLPKQHLPDQHRMLQLRSGLQLDQRYQQYGDLPALRQEGRALLHRQHLPGCGDPVPVQQLDRHLRMQSLRRPGRALLLDLDHKPKPLQRRERRLRQLDQHLQGLRRRRRSLLRQQHLQ